MTARIDAHQHYWQLSRSDYAWMQPQQLSAIRRDFMPRDMAPLLAASDVIGTVLVQADATERETDFLLEIADVAPDVLGVVGWVDFMAKDAVAKVERRAAQAAIRGLRPMLEFIADPDWILQPAFDPVFRAMIRTGLRFDALIHPHHLAAIDMLLQRYPDLQVVIDHGAKPKLAAWHADTAAMAYWRAGMQCIARYPQARCKLSGLLTEAGSGWHAETVLPAMQILLDLFGPSRLIWGSDWPVMTLAGGYEDWVVLCDRVLARLSAEERDAVWRRNALDFYRL